MTEKLSICINSYNGETVIRECLESAMWADEVIVQDCSSTDKTAEIARQYTDKVFVVPNNPLMPNVNFNKLIERASHPWVLLISHDERVSPELKDEILSLLSNGAEHMAYWIPRRNLVLGRWMEGAGYGPDQAPQLRLFRRDRARFACQDIHESVTVDGSIGHLKAQLFHNHTSSVGQYISKSCLYSINEAEVLLRSQTIIHWQDLVLMPARRFAYQFFFAKGYQDGVTGLVVSLLGAMEHAMAVMRAWELASNRLGAQEARPSYSHFRDRVLVCIARAFWELVRSYLSCSIGGRLVRRLRGILKSEIVHEQARHHK